MFFRFTSAIVLVVLVSMSGVMMEKRMLDLRRDLSRQQYRTDILLDQYTAIRLKTQELSSPDRMLETMQNQELAPRPLVRDGERRELTGSAERKPGLPLLNWERPVRAYRWRRRGTQ